MRNKEVIYELKEHEVVRNLLDTKEPECWSGEHFKNNLSIDISKLTPAEMAFDMIGVDASIANAFRRIMISEVPSMALEKIVMENNTSIIPDDVLAHRLGLIPIRADPRKFNFLAPDVDILTADEDTLTFELRVRCTKNPQALSGISRPDDLYLNSNVYSKDMKWKPSKLQEGKFTEEEVGPVFPDILIAKLRPGQEISFTAIAVKGIGRDHAKFSPVATASYRLMPSINIRQPVTGSLAKELKECFANGVIGIRKNNDGQDEAYVLNPRLDDCRREVLRHEKLSDRVCLGRVKDHFIFTVEATSGLPADAIFKESIRILKEKCSMFTRSLSNVE